MDWTAHDVINRPLTWYQHVSDSKRLNDWQAFKTVALPEYCALSQDQQLIIICAATGSWRLIPSLVNGGGVVKRESETIRQSTK